MHFTHYCFAAAMLTATMFVSACSSPTQRIEIEARRSGLVHSTVQGTSFRHTVFARAGEDGEVLTVFLEGDGLPWIAGQVPAADPTSRDPLALHLATQSPGRLVYVGRPCYHELNDPACSFRAWTFERYSTATVESMAAAIAAQARSMQTQSVRLIGYSGGGVLAVLIAERLPNVAAVVTIAANLDVEAWASHHGYLPLEGSLNPARSTQPHPWKELHLQGSLDTAVPIATTREYFERFPNAKRVAFENYSHICCWLPDWAEVQQRIEAELR